MQVESLHLRLTNFIEIVQKFESYKHLIKCTKLADNRHNPAKLSHYANLNSLSYPTITYIAYALTINNILHMHKAIKHTLYTTNFIIRLKYRRSRRNIAVLKAHLLLNCEPTALYKSGALKLCCCNCSTAMSWALWKRLCTH